MITYEIKHHIPGRIRIAMPITKMLSREKLRKLADTAVKMIALPEGIHSVRANPLNYHLVIEYDPVSIDIIEYLNHMSTDNELLAIVNDAIGC